jgi:hypothetical protein
MHALLGVRKLPFPIEQAPAPSGLTEGAGKNLETREVSQNVPFF